LSNSLFLEAVFILHPENLGPKKKIILEYNLNMVEKHVLNNKIL